MSRVVQRRDGQSGLLGLGSDGETVNAGMIGVGFLGIFGRGMFRVFNANDNFTIPANVKRIRVRVIGAGGGTTGVSTSGGGWVCSGAGGGGYAHGVFDVVPGDVFSLVIGAPGTGGAPGSNPGTAGGTTSFGSLISATGGQPGATAAAGTVPGGIGGIGIGGDFQAPGGKGGDGTAAGRPGSGGASGSQLGPGGNGATGVDPNDCPGGGGLGGNHASANAAGSAFGPGGLLSDKYAGGPDIRGIFNTTAALLVENPIDAVCRFPFDIFTGAASYSGGMPSGARSAAGAGGPGIQSTSFSASPGGHGGGGGVLIGSSAHRGGEGGIGGGAGAASGASKPGAPGGRGLIIVEW
ncbi:hypothetical protein [Shinella sp. HZN7]|uniref:hypothetical protein n=1 Tax=Shinella sp. (strain HZN7) TaxID=879274 RepID=UPI0007DA88E6|nr:hypothetical protein [Shinella sp. HZN7]ANH04592.1 hypothetical protein shn_11460 [Shinella sp. HZN7]